MKRIEVVAAVICRENQIFVTQRGYGEWKGYWEFPGGKVEPGESHEEALIREIREELDTEIRVEGPAGRVEYEYPQFHLSLYCYFCRILSGRLELKEHEAAKWLTWETLDSVNWLPADVSLVRELKQKAAAAMLPDAE